MLTTSDANLLALRQTVQHVRQRIAGCVNTLEDLIAGPPFTLPSGLGAKDKVEDVILDLKYVIDFYIGEPKP